MYGNGLTLPVSKRFDGPQSPPVESERWWLEMARRKKQAATGPGRQGNVRSRGRLRSGVRFTSRPQTECRAFVTVPVSAAVLAWVRFAS